MLTKQEIIGEMLANRHPSSDGCVTSERINYICTVFGVETVDLDSVFDVSHCLSLDDPYTVLAVHHLLLLQMDYAARLDKEGYFDGDEGLIKSAFLQLSLMKVDWHFDHLVEGVPTPPFRSIH